MSRLAKNKIIIPQGVEVNIDKGEFKVKGPKGELSRKMRREVDIILEDGAVSVKQTSNSRLAKTLIGTFASHIRNMIEGVTEGFKKTLKIEGVGYRADMSDKNLQLKVGFSHLVSVKVPEGLNVNVTKNNEIEIEGFDKELVGNFAASTRNIKKPEPYKGKGIRYIDEVVRRKQGKTK